MTPEKNKLARIFPALFGTFLGLALLKFGNPCVLDRLVERPTGILLWLMNPWPMSVGLGLLLGLAVWGLGSARRQVASPRWPVWLPLAWLGWQLVSATHTVSGELTRATLLHFTACVACFYLGWFALPQTQGNRRFFAGLFLGWLAVIVVGWQQRFGGLEETRQYFFAYIYPQLPEVSPEYLKKISSHRIYSTLFYPNALAGALLLLLPLALVLAWQLGSRLTTATRGFLVGLTGLAGLACLAWSGSKAGWLLMLFLGVVALLRLKLERRWNLLLPVLLLAAGLTGFGLRYAAYFQKGATSAAARIDYWQAAARTAAANPVFGTGPGTFAIPYKVIKRPESEMARLVHNDYLQQASDSGLAGFLSYTCLVGWALWTTFKKAWSQSDWLRFSIWLGLLGWFLQGLTEFGLYIPALAWTAFCLLGWSLAAGNEFDTRRNGSYSPGQR